MNVGEIWKDIEGYDGEYKISSLGIVSSFKNGRIKVLAINKDSHIYLSKNGQVKRFSVPLLVATYFLPNPHGYERVRVHGDGLSVNDIEWVDHTIAYNRNGGKIIGKSAIIDDDTARLMWEDMESGMTYKEVQDKYNVTYSVPYYMKIGKTYNRITGIDYTRKGHFYPTREQILEIYKMYTHNKLTCKEISERLEQPYALVTNICSGRSYNHITNADKRQKSTKDYQMMRTMLLQLKHDVEIAEECNLSRRTVQRYKKKMKENGELI